MKDSISKAGKKIKTAGICFFSVFGLAAIQIILVFTQALDEDGLTAAMVILSLLGLIFVILGSLSLVQGGSLLIGISPDEEEGDTKQNYFPAWIVWGIVVVFVIILQSVLSATV